MGFRFGRSGKRLPRIGTAARKPAPVAAVHTRRAGEGCEHAFAHQEDRIQMEGASDAFVRFDRSLRIIAVSDATLSLFGMSRNQLVGRVAAEALPHLKNSELERTLQYALASQRVVVIEHFHLRSGRWFLARCYPTLRDVTVFANDISIRKKAEESLRLAHAELAGRIVARTQELHAANRLLQAIFDRAPSGIAITDIDGNFVRANAALLSLVGYSERELLRLSLKSVIAPEDFPKKQAMLQQLLNGHRKSFKMEARYVQASGERIWVKNFVSTIQDETGRPRYFVKIAQDISDRKHAEQEIVATQQELRRLYDRLQSVREEERVALAREVHDQLGQLLSAAKIDIKLLQDEIRPQDAPLSRRKIVGELRSACRSLDQAIQMVRQIATELRAPELEEQGLHAAIAWQARDFERRTRIRCSVAISAGMREPQGAAATALLRIFGEAMTNVLRHAKARNVWVSLEPRGAATLLRVRDDGVGIASHAISSMSSLGLKGMRERAALCAGRLVVGPLQSRGTLVSALIPQAQAGYGHTGGRAAHAQQRDTA